jgi:hypothetical protein
MGAFMKDLIIQALELILGEASINDVAYLMANIPATSTDEQIIDAVYSYVMTNGESLTEVD